jgi:predicted nucleic acid-binding protein
VNFALTLPLKVSGEPLREAKTRGIIPRVRPILGELIAAGMYISEALYEAFLRQLDEAEDTQSP